MPQLPSGQHVAISPAPLHDLLLRADDPHAAHRILALSQPEDIHTHIEVQWLLPAPEGFVAVSSGYTLEEWELLAAEWTDADRWAMREFLEGHVAPLLEQCREAVAGAQAMIRSMRRVAAFV